MKTVGPASPGCRPPPPPSRGLASFDLPSPVLHITGRRSRTHVKMRKIIPRQKRAWHAASTLDADPWRAGEQAQPRSQPGTQTPRPGPTINSVRQRERLHVRIISAPNDLLPKTTGLQTYSLSASHPSAPRTAGPRRPPPIKIRWLSGASWKVAITNPIYDSLKGQNQKVGESE